MGNRTWLLILGSTVVLAVPAIAAQNESMTGCLDENPGPQYVLRGDQELRLLALLEPQGFQVESFAKYLGHKIRVTGVLTTRNNQPVLTVRSLQDVAGVCRPQTDGTISPATASNGSSGLESHPKTASGCLDEEPGPQYVLRGDRELVLLYELEPDGFPVQSFAKFLGHKVELSGNTGTRDGRPSMLVKSIRNLSDRCLPPAK